MDADAITDLLYENLHRDKSVGTVDLYRYLNLGQERIVNDAPHVLGTNDADITTVADTQEYSLESDFYKMRAMWNVTTSRPMDPISHTSWSQLVEARVTKPTGSPRRFLIPHFDDSLDLWRIRFYPTPAAVETITYFYYWAPAEMTTGTDVSPISSIGFDELLLTAATMIAKRRNDPEGAAIERQYYKELLKEYKSFNAQGPALHRRLASQRGDGRSGSTLRLPPEFPN